MNSLLRSALVLPLLQMLATAQWTQWGGDFQHDGSVRVAGQFPQRILTSFAYDPFAALSQAENGGELITHYPSPLLDGRDVFMMFKSGNYTSCRPPGSGTPAPCGPDAWNSQVWTMRAMRWVNGTLRTRWMAESDWKPVPNGAGVESWEPVFHAAIDDRFLYMPAAGGELMVMHRHNGKLLRRVQPLGNTTSANRYVVSPVTVDAIRGAVYYTVLEMNPRDPWAENGSDIPNSFLVRVNRDGTSQFAQYRTLVPGAPASCLTDFEGDALPWPPAPNATPPGVPCLSQRPGVNAAPAIGPDGTVYTVTRAHHPRASRYSYLVAANPDLTPKWSASLRDRLADGCGAGIATGCRAGTRRGVDPATNQLPAGEVSDLSSSSPAVAPDGSILYGAFTGSNYVRGHLFHFNDAGAFLNAFDFGWDTTPAVWAHDGTYSVILKENNYEGIGSYCGDPRVCPPNGRGPFYITQLDANLQVEGRYQNTNSQKCSRQDDGTVACQPAPAGGFEWCVNAPVVDALGNVYANSEDGNLYVIAQGGTEIARIFLNLAVGAAYTPLAIGYDGRIYSENDGKMFIVGE